MKLFQNKVYIFLSVFVLSIAALLVFRTGVLNTPKHIKGIEEIGVSFDDDDGFLSFLQSANV